MRNPVEEFERQYQALGDPWDLATSPYEQERYASTLAALPRARYARALELGASIGVLSERLAPRCDRLITLEPAPTAVRAARARLADSTHVDVRHGSAPEDMPDGPFDLVVASEVLYYFSEDELDGVLDAIEHRLEGELVAAHWRGLGTHQLTGGQVHARLRERFTRVAGANRAGYELEVFIAPAALGRVGRRAVG